MALHHQNAFVKVSDQSGKSISFSVDQSACILVGGAKQIEVFANPYCCGNGVVPPRVIWEVLIEGQHPNGNACVGRKMSPPQNSPFVCPYSDPISSLGLAVDVLDAAAEHPGVFASNADITLCFQGDCGVEGVAFLHAAKLCPTILSHENGSGFQPNLSATGLDDSCLVPLGEHQPRCSAMPRFHGVKEILR